MAIESSKENIFINFLIKVGNGPVIPGVMLSSKLSFKFTLSCEVLGLTAFSDPRKW